MSKYIDIIDAATKRVKTESLTSSRFDGLSLEEATARRAREIVEADRWSAGYDAGHRGDPAKWPREFRPLSQGGIA